MLFPIYINDIHNYYVLVLSKIYWLTKTWTSVSVFNILFCLYVKIHFIWHENKDSINSGSADTIQTKCSYQLPLFCKFLSAVPKTIVIWYLNNHNLLVLSVLGGISVWHKVDGDISLKQPYTFVCVFSPKPLKLQAKLFCHFIAFSSPLDWSIKPTTCQL